MNRPLILTLVLVLGLSPWIRAADAPATLDPKVHDVLAASAAFYAAKKTVEGDISTAMNIGMNGMKQEMDSSFHLAVAQPNSFALVLQSGMMGGTMISDGKTIVTYMPIMDKYTSTQAPDNLSDLLQPMNVMMTSGGPLSIGFETFFRKDPIKLFEENLTSSKDFGLEKIGDVQAHHVQLISSVYTTDYWIKDGASPVLLQTRASMDTSGALKNLPADQKKKLPSGATSMTMSTTATFTNWKFDQPVAPDTFVFHPPGNAKLVADFLPPQPPHPLVGKMAPDFELKDLDGKSVSLKSLRGKIVVLDFWATWCGPCVATLPTVIKVTSSFADKGVVFYTVNLKEKADDIRKFQTSKSLAFPVLLDSDGKAADLYQAQAIPQSVLIDKNGKIQVVHVGYSQSLKQTLTQQLTDMLAGKDLASASDTETPAPASSPTPAPTP